MSRYPLINRRALGQNCPVGQFWDGTQCRGGVGTIPGGAGVPTLPGTAPATAPAPGTVDVSPTSGTPAGATPQKNLIACINGPDLYDIYNPDMSVVAKGVLNPNVSYPDAQIDFAKFPPCPVPQATGVGGLCDVPAVYLAPKDPSGPPGREVLACYVPNNGVTLLDYVTGAPIANHLSSACFSLLSSVTIAQDGDPRCAGLVASSGGTPSVMPPSTETAPTQTPVTPPSTTPGTIPTQPIQQPKTPPVLLPIQQPGLPGGSPWPGYGSPIGVSAPAYAKQGIQAQSLPQQPLVAPPVRMQCVNNPSSLPMDKWFESCPGVQKARGY